MLHSAVAAVCDRRSALIERRYNLCRSVIVSAPKSSEKSFVFSAASSRGSPTFHALRVSQSDMTTQFKEVESRRSKVESQTNSLTVRLRLSTFRLSTVDCF